MPTFKTLGGKQLCTKQLRSQATDQGVTHSRIMSAPGPAVSASASASAVQAHINLSRSSSHGGKNGSGSSRAAEAAATAVARACSSYRSRSRSHHSSSSWHSSRGFNCTSSLRANIVGWMLPVAMCVCRQSQLMPSASILSFTSWLVVGIHRQLHRSSIIDPLNVIPCPIC
jgi:hypothetical protein